MCGYSEVSPNILLPLYSCFLIQFSKGQVKSAENLHMPICFLSKNEKKPSPFSNIDFFLIMFPLNLLTVCSMCMVANHLCPEAPTLHTAAVRHHCLQLLYAITTTTNAAIAINPSQQL